MIHSWCVILLICAVFGIGGFGFVLSLAGEPGPYEGAGLAVTLAVPPVLAGFLAFRTGLAAIGRMSAARTDTEHEQIVIRILLVSLILAYVLVLVLAEGTAGHLVRSVLILPTVFAGSWLLLVHLMLEPGPSVPRRVVGNLLDMSMVSAFLHVGGAMAAPWYLIYLWVTFGNGFRYGPRFLMSSAVLGAAGFAWVIHATPFWLEIPHVAYGLLAALLVLPAYVARLIRQLTEAKVQAEAANRAKGRFLATVSHELRTPLTAIIGMGEMMMGTRLDGEQREMAATVNASAKQLLSLITDVLDFSQLEEAKLTIDSGPFDLHRVLYATRLMLRGQARAKRLALRLVIGADVPRTLVGDGRRLQQALTNLLANAVKFTEAGGVTLSVRVVRSAPERGGHRMVLEFRVADTGIGIAPQHLDRIFDRFTQAEDDINRRYGGTGLGLAISRQLVELMGGTIGVSSELHRGSEFWITLPALAPESGIPEPGTSEPGISEPGISEPGGREWAGEGVVADAPEADARLTAALREDSALPVLLIPRAALDDPATALEPWLESADGVERAAVVLVGATPLDAARRARAWRAELVLSCADDPEQVARALGTARSLAAAAAGAAASGGGGEPVTSGRRCRILVAEDNAINRRVIEKILQRAGHEAVFAADGDEALDLLDRSRFDIVLMDMNMPAVSGLDVARMYRFTHTDRPHLPIVALTAEATEAARRQCAEAGMDAFLTKPVDPGALFATIARLVDGGTRPAVPVPTWAVPAAATGPADLGGGAEPGQGGAYGGAHGGAPGQDEPSIDAAALDKLRSVDGDPAFLAQIAREFLNDAEELVGELEHAWASGDLHAFKDHAHSLRSSASYVGAAPLVRLLLSCRDLSRDELAEEGYRRVKDIQAEFVRVRAALRELA
ncbi:response regulator [Skermanella sp. TT6]|uniref:histidine kinase n=1 Tax=Skermanella cutis TaxID=2775420 RepID=A0ABX7B368_9PROT|nr:ATP-binding protein [Skermanella sp. TT6]QQP88783.1 response regulator [Skermanella sp. TT6]